ncbi:MAG: N-acetylmuramoyl-L-alanine amidase [Prevotella sp.]|nr:N-acetylmuramoyl-L-alanine amidase [Prevotella sp.]
MYKRLLSIILLSVLALGVSMAANKRFTLVIDAGHGGKDAGACGKTSKEKNLTLKYALAFGKIVERNCPDVKVVYTRKTDTFLELWQRAEIANKNKANLFVSVHINALEGGKVARGIQTYTLGKGETTGKKGIQENLEVAKRENSVIFLESNYKKTYQGFDPNSPESSIMFEFIQDKNMEQSVELARYMQKNLCAATGRLNKGAHQNNLAVLRLTSMPGCLLELGYISTSDEEAFLNSNDAVIKFSSGFYKAFMEYRKKYDNTLISVPFKAKPIEPEIPEIVPDEYKNNNKKNERARTKKESEKKVTTDEMASVEGDSSKVVEKKSETTNGNAPVFKVQLFVSDAKLKESDKRLKGLTDVDYYTEGRLLKYTTGASTNYNEIYRLRKNILEQFPDAFIIAFRGDKKMDVNEAIAEFKRNRGK